MPVQQQLKPSSDRPIRVEEWDSLPGGRLVAVAVTDGEAVLIAKRGAASTEFLRELEGVMSSEVVSGRWSCAAPGRDQAA